MRTHCKNGHPWDEKSSARNGEGYVICKLCKNANERKRKRAKPKKPKVIRTHCMRGHEFTPENVYVRPDGGKRCRTCIDEYRKPPEERGQAFMTRRAVNATLTPLGDILKCPACDSRKKYRLAFRWKCCDCGTHYDEYGTKMHQKTKFTPAPKSGQKALPITIGRGLTQWY